MKVFFLIQRFNKPSSRYRVLQYLPFLKAAGFETEVEEVSGRWLSRVPALRRAGKAPVVFIQKKLFHALELRMLRAGGARLVYDFDDAIMLRHASATGADSASRRRRFARTARACRAVFAGNRFLEQKAREFNDSVIYLPTTIDTDKLRSKSEWNSRETVTLGWLGSPGTLVYLEKILPALEEVVRRFPQVRLKIICSHFPDSAKIEILRKVWKEEDEEADLRSLDIGLAPLAQDAWSEGKCGLKLLQYLACGLPSVASPGGAQKEIIQDGVNGYLANGEKEWVEKLSILIKDVEKRKTFGIEGRRTVEKKYSLKWGAAIMSKVLGEIEKSGKR